MKDYNLAVKAVIAHARKEIESINKVHYDANFIKGSPFDKKTGMPNAGELAVSNQFREILKEIDNIEVSFKQYPQA